MKRCDSCGRPIFWALTCNDKKIRLDPTPHLIAGPHEASFVLDGFGRDQRAVALSKADQEDGRLRHRYTVHVITCPNSHRKAA